MPLTQGKREREISELFNIRPKGNDKFEKILENYTEGYKEKRKAIQTALKEGKFILNLTDGTKLDCQKGKDAKYTKQDIHMANKYGSIYGCQFMQCTPRKKNHHFDNIYLITPYNTSMEGFTSPVALASNQRNGFTKKNDIASITAVSLKYPLFQSNPKYSNYLKKIYNHQKKNPSSRLSPIPFEMNDSINFLMDPMTKMTVKVNKTTCDSKDTVIKHFNNSYYKFRKKISNEDLIQLIES